MSGYCEDCGKSPCTGGCAEKRSVSASGSNELLCAETMKDLGFTEKWPGGNPTEPWWENPEEIDVGDIWITELLPKEDFWRLIAEAFREQGRKEVRSHLKAALGT